MDVLHKWSGCLKTSDKKLYNHSTFNVTVAQMMTITSLNLLSTRKGIKFSRGSNFHGVPFFVDSWNSNIHQVEVIRLSHKNMNPQNCLSFLNHKNLNP